MPDLAIGDVLTLDNVQLAVITGVAAGELKPGHMFSWCKGRFKINGVQPGGCEIVRLAAAWPRGTEPAMHTPRDPDVALLPYKNPEYQPGAGVRHHPRPKLGPLEKKVAEPGTMEAGDVVEKVELLGPELKSPHTWILRSPQFNEPVDQGRQWSSRNREARRILARMLGLSMFLNTAPIGHKLRS